MNESTWKYVIKDMKKRNKTGIKKYGIPLNTTTTKDCLQELYEELLDAVVYLKTELEKRKIIQQKPYYIPKVCILDEQTSIFKPYPFSER